MENIVNANTTANEITRHNLFDLGTPQTKCNLGLGICSVPMQEWEPIYNEDTGFSAGTIFPCLNKPFLGGGR